MADQISQAKTDKEALEMYIDQLIKEKNSPYVTDKNRQEIKEFLLKDLFEAINRKFVSLLSDEEVKELNRLLDNKASDQEISDFFAKKIPNQQEVLTEILLDFRKGYLSVRYPVSTESDKASSSSSKFSAPVAPPPAPVLTPTPAPVVDASLKKMN